MARFRCTQAVWTSVVCIMFVLNILFIIDLTFHHNGPNAFIAFNNNDTNKLIRPLNTGEQWRKWVQEGPHQGPPKFLSIKVLSSRESASVAVDGQTVYSADSQRGMHVVVLNQMNGEVMASRVFDTYTPGGDDALPTFLHSLADGRILCFAILDEGTFSLKDDARNAIAKLDSQLIKTIKWRYTWAFVTIKGKGSVGEDIGRSVSLSIWGTPVNLHVTVPLLAEDSVQCKWAQSPDFLRRRSFCSKYEGYKDICDCSNPMILSQGVPLSSNEVANIPVTIIASNRPQYLFRMLKTLLSTPGSNASYTTVYIDGFFQEPADVASLFGVRAIRHEPLSQKNGRIAQHYKASLTKTFDSYPNAKYTIILEEDLDVAPDFFRYFSQTKHLLEEDSSLYCISAWNDQGYDHSCQDPSALYRIETMPGLGWLLSRKLYKEELEPQWPSPDKLWDWDMWMRTDFMRKGRECVIPDISRTYHFGASGLNMNPYFQTAYFKKHSLNKDPNAVLKNVDRLKKNLYEEDVKKLIASAKVLDHTKDPCQKDFIPNTKDLTYIMYMTMEKRHDYGTWMQLAKCFHLWDLDARGFHKGLWRFWLKGNRILVMGVPYSPYKGYMPSNVIPIKKEKKEKQKKSKRKS